ncbi:MAG: hypothetical protein LBP63_06935 [Prevotellaceae bacterium]|jgi:hypothetical protein|nr:hypothetical protein [Prevotellaceae bacterium]
MKRILLSLLLVLPLYAAAQTVPPSWTQDAQRERNYPSSDWYTGFVRNRLKAGANEGVALKTLERDAQNQLAESIIITVDGNTQMQSASRSVQSGSGRLEQIHTDYVQAVRTATTATTVKSEVKSYHDPASGAIYAFAAVRRADLATFYQKQIDLDLNKVETALSIAEQLIKAGKKMSASRKCSEAEKLFTGVILYQDLLAAVNADADESALQTARSGELQRTVAQSLIDLEQSAFVYVDCKYEYKGYKDDAFSSDPGIICDIVKQALSENECSIVDDDAEADYTLTLATSTTQRSDGKGQYGIISYYANVKGSLYNHLTKKKTADFSIFNDPDTYVAGKSPEAAATKAFKLPALKDKILDKILPKIKN